MGRNRRGKTRKSDQLVHNIKRHIDLYSTPKSDKPTIEGLAHHLQLDVGTVKQAIDVLLERGLINKGMIKL